MMEIGYFENGYLPLSPCEGAFPGPAFYFGNIANFTHICYSYLTLDRNPDSYQPAQKYWDGSALYDSVFRDNIVEVMNAGGIYNAQPLDIRGLSEACKLAKKQFIWTIGGQSDLTKTITEEQIPLLVSKCIELLKICGDGIDFKWEHLSDDPAITGEQRATLGKTLVALRNGLDEAGMKDKVIGYTTRYNAFFKTPPAGFASDCSNDGEGMDVIDQITKAGKTVESVLSWVNLMTYDVSPKYINSDKGLSFENFVTILNTTKAYVPASIINVGFEPGPQASGAVWEGLQVDEQVVLYIIENGFGGMFFWAINEPASIDNLANGLRCQQMACMQLAG